MDGQHYWEENGHSVKYGNYNANESQLNFSTSSGLGAQSDAEDEIDFGSSAYLKKGKVSRQDPMSHRIIEKRRRDRMNNCLADLSRLIPPEYLKKGRGRVEKTEIIEMAIRHLKFLQDKVNHRSVNSEDSGEGYRTGYQECASETLRCLVEQQGYAPGDSLCLHLMNHLQRHFEMRNKSRMDANPEGTGSTRFEPVPLYNTDSSRQREKSKPRALNSPDNSGSSQSSGYLSKGVIRQPAPLGKYPDKYEKENKTDQYIRNCDKGDLSVENETPAHENGNSEPLPLDGRRNSSPVHIGKHNQNGDHDDHQHSYKFKNCIERRFSRSQDCEEKAQDMSMSHQNKHSAKRWRHCKPSCAASASASASTSTFASASTSAEDSEHAHAPHSPHLVPVFALNSTGKYYVPASVEYGCLSRHFSPCTPLPMAASSSPILLPPLHPVTLHVSYQPCLHHQHCHSKPEKSPDSKSGDMYEASYFKNEHMPF